MIGAPVLVDSSFYIQTSREGRDPFRELLPVAMTRGLVICGVVRAEVGRGIRDPRTLERYRNLWRVMENVEINDGMWADAEELVWNLDRKGVILPLTDVLIACCARRAKAVVLTNDHHFGLIPGLTSVSRLV